LSWQATAWAIKQRDIEESSTKFVLLCLANYAGEDGKNAFPAVSTLAEDTVLSESTVRRKLQDLEQAGYIAKGNQAIVIAYIEHAGRRPTVYDLNLSRGVTVTPVTSTGVSNTGGRGVKTPVEGCQALTPNPKEILPKQECHIATFGEDFRSRFGYDPTEIPAQQKKVKQ
jgi:hypothetical protein